MFSSTDIASFLACPHTATLARAESKGEIPKAFFNGPAVDLLQRFGREPEAQFLRELAEADGLAVVQIAPNDLWQDALGETVRALHDGVDAVYQAAFLDGKWRG